MGAKISLLAPHAHTVAVRSYIDVLPDYQFLDVVNNTRFLKTMRAYNIKTKSLVVIKIFIKPPQTNVQLNETVELLTKEASLLAPYPNFLPWNRIIETDSAGYMMRQLAKTNLYDRLSIRPFLSTAEKLWLAFQMLKSLELLHDQLHSCHGDIKLENFLVTNSNWLLLTDFSQHLKPVFLPDDNPSEFVFYFDSSNRRSCYVSPERFYNSSSPPEMISNFKDWTLGKPADIFSLGCVIAELFRDGEPTFTLSDLYRYKKGELELNLSSIGNSQVQSMVESMLTLDSKKRPSAAEILHDYKSVLFPSYYYSFLYDFVAKMNNSNNFVVPPEEQNKCPSDLQIEKIYASFENIISAFDFQYSIDPEQGVEGFPHFRLNLPGLPEGYVIQSSRNQDVLSSESRAQGCLMLLDLIFSLVKSLKRPSNKIKACELILILSERISDQYKLDRSLPYLFTFIDDFIRDASESQDEGVAADPSTFHIKPNISSRVASVALVSVTNLLNTCGSVNAINSHIFPEFILPKLKNIAFLNCPFKEHLDHVKMTLATCIPFLSIISEKFVAFTEQSQEVKARRKSATEEAKHRGRPTKRTEVDIKDLVEALLTDSNVHVRICLLKNIYPVCKYFGVDKTNDIILPHLITYLNDPSYQLRLAFLDSIIEVGSFIGVLAFEQYLLPLLVQTLGDSEPFVVLKVLEIFHHFVKNKLINPNTEFNALSMYKELLNYTLVLLLQPNEWIRQSVIYLILAISENLSNADRFCFLYPLIKSYLSYDVSELSWNTMYPCLTKPLSRQVFNLALTWLSKSTSKSVFWKQTDVSILKNNGSRKLVSFSKEMGKSVYIGRNKGLGRPVDDLRNTSEVPLSHEDRQWILKMKSVGMDEKDLWKIFALKDYFVKISRSSFYNEVGDQRNFELATTVNIPPMNIFFEVRYKSEPIADDRRRTETSYESSSNGGQMKDRESAKSLVLSPVVKAKASLQTNEANAFGEMDFSHDDFLNSRGLPSEDRRDNLSSTNRVFSTDNEKIISATMRHNFTGTNPFIMKYLEHIDFEPSLDDFPEFGQLLKSNQDASNHNKEEVKIKGRSVVKVNTNSDPTSIDAITKISVSPSSEFFVTGSDSGALKLWDISKIETLQGKHPTLSLNLGHRVTDVVFIPHRLCFAVSTADGKLRIFRVQVVRGKSKQIVKYSKLAMIRHAQLDSGYATSLTFLKTANKFVCAAITSNCKIIGFDIIKMEKVFSLDNPPHLGVPTTFVTPNDGSWLLLGTKSGHLCLWDLRFQILLKSWRVKVDGRADGSEVKKLVIVSSKGQMRQNSEGLQFAMVGGCDEPDVTIWHIPSFECREFLGANQTMPKIKKYQLEEVNASKELSIDDMFAEFALDHDQKSHDYNTTLQKLETRGDNSSPETFLVTSTSKNRLIAWNLSNIGKSISLSDPTNASFTRNQVTSQYAVSFEKLSAEAATKDQVKMEFDHDQINDVAVIVKPFYMIVTAGRNGTIHAYK